ncbi:MAG: TonB-dependent receptor [Gammaproteobacteria bacterium]|nr:TonB-dependent receptor [Gammaproteobacteria bacterium]
MKKPLLAGISATIAASVAIPVLAQEQADFQIEEIVVTAAKRETTLQEVPVAVSVVSAEQIQRSQILDIKDLQFLVPSLKVTQLQTTGNTNFIIRGFGNGANNAGIEPSVGVFIDGVYRSRTAASMADFPNIERIEVLRGPQSTLFGKNASAGVISVITAKPDLDAYSGSVSLTAGDYSQWIVKGDVTGPISDKVAFSLSGGMNQRDGYYTNLVNGEEYGERDRWNVRGQLLFQPSDTVEVRLIADYEEIDEACCGVANLVDGPTGLAVRAIGGNLVGNAPFAYENYYDFDPVNQFENGGVSMQIDWDITDSMMLTSISAARTLDRFENSDVDFTSAPLISDDSGNSLDTTIDTLTQELRLQSTGDNTIDWMVGLYYFDEEVDTSSKIAYGPGFRPYADILSGGAVSQLEGIMVQAGLLPAPGIFFAEGQGNDELSGQENTATSVFGQVDWHLTDRVTLTAGMNYTKDEKDAFVNMTNTDVFSGLDLLQVSTGIGAALIFQQLVAAGTPPAQAAQIAAALSTVACTPQNAPNCNPALAFTALSPLQFLPPFVGFPNAVESGRTEDDDTTWTLRLAFDVTDSLNMYVGAGTGFKASSWNLSRDSRPFASDIAALTSAGLSVNNLVAGTRYAGPEESTVYEVGLKYFGERARWNLTVFDQEIEGFQGNIFTGTGFVLANAGKQSTTGVEFDVQWNPVDAVQLALSATWLDPVYDSFPGGNGVSGPEDLSGKKVPGVPELAMNANANYNFQVGATNGFIRFEYIYEDEVQIIENVPANVASREISMVNASTGLAWDNGFEAMIWARNLNNDEFLLSAFPAVAQAGSYSGYPNEPRTYGITVRKYFD